MNIAKQTRTRDKHMTPNRQVATLVGVLFIIATVTAILGVTLYEPILDGPNYLANGAAHENQVILGALMELILACTAIGTAIVLFPVLRPYSERIALGHLAFRFFEAVVIAVGIVSVLSLLTLSKEFVAADAPNVSAFHASGTVLLAVHDWTFMLGPLFLLGLNTVMYSYLLYKSQLVPRALASVGIGGAILVFGYGLLVLFGIADQGAMPAVLLALPIAAYEMILAVWLIVKGFNSSASASVSVQTATNELLSVA